MELFDSADTPFSLKLADSSVTSNELLDDSPINTSESANSSSKYMGHNTSSVFVGNNGGSNSTSLTNLDSWSSGAMQNRKMETDKSADFVKPLMLKLDYDNKSNDRVNSALMDDFVLQNLLNTETAPDPIDPRDRRHSEVITEPLNALNGERNSISHTVDFWNLGFKKFGEDKLETVKPQLDSNVSQHLNEFNMDFQDKPKKPNKHRALSLSSAITNDYFNNNSLFTINNAGNQLNSDGYKTKQVYSVNKRNTRNSFSHIDPTSSQNTDLFISKLKNGLASSTSEQTILSDDEDDWISLDSPITSSYQKFSPIDRSTQKFIKPSMILSENASTAAKMATTGTEQSDFTPRFNDTPKILKLNNHNIYNQQLGSIDISSIVPALQKQHMHSHSAIQQLQQQQQQQILSTRRRRSSVSKPIATSLVTDDDLKPFKCNDCEKAFRRSEHLKRHIRSVHSNERPFPCTYCDKKFSRSDNLSQHLKTHKKHGDF